ncbi:MAG: bifunctional DNA-formamidopyrimidine glycosylase/DNA-(apurinic or apyrimidinic site) lyase [Pirellulales bacterium]
MPELPEVETMRRGILSIVGRQIEELRVPRCGKRPILISPKPATFGRRVAKRRVTAVERVGKRVVVRLDSLDAIVFEPRMTGLVLLADPPTREHLRLAIRFSGAGNRELLFWDRRGLGLVRLVAPRQFEELYGRQRLGPDALAISCDELRQCLMKSRREIKVALFDQRALAGVGNLYASEILHRAGVHPQRRCDRLRRDEWQAIHRELVEVLQEAIRYEGSTLGDGTYRNALNEQGSYQNHHRVYDRAEQPCRQCGRATIRRIVQAQRSTFFCPACQPRTRRASATR